uniref:Uncharacterized protein n=1 Tax=viral metagenome TaxID=1070528 RepID=A0A6M3IET8_9ZZZZ
MKCGDHENTNTKELLENEFLEELKETISFLDELLKEGKERKIKIYLRTDQPEGLNGITERITLFSATKKLL